MAQQIRKAVFPVGGLGTRFLPATKALPKEMLPVVDKPIIHYAFEEAQESGIEQFIFVTGRNKTAIDNHFDHAYELQSILESDEKHEALEQITNWMPEPGQVFFTRQQAAKGLGHAVWCARHLIGNEPFAVILPDDMILGPTPCLKQMMEAYAHTPGNFMATMDVPRELTRQYGVIDASKEQGRLLPATQVVEKPQPEQAPSTHAIVGRYILEPSIFDILGKAQKGTGGEIQLTDAINRLIPSTPTYGYRFEGRRFDCGNRLGFIEANIAFGLAREDMHERIAAMLKRYVE